MLFVAFCKPAFKKSSFLLLPCFLVALQTTAQAPALTYLGIEKGLSNNSVRCIYQDHNGFMWFGTYDGLNRYDGYDFTVFRNKLDDSASLPYNYINVITEDASKNLWVGTGQGIGIYNSLRAKWAAAFYLPAGGSVKEKITANINTIETDRVGNLFIGTANAGLLVKSRNGDIAHQITMLQGGKNRTDYTVQSIETNGRGQVWLTIEDIGLCYYDHASKKISLLTASIRSIQCLESTPDALWLGTKNGLFVYRHTNQTVERFPVPTTSKKVTLNITSLLMDKQRRLWMGTEGDGVYILNTVTGVLESITPGDEKQNITSGAVNAIFADRESRTWIGTLKGGINIVDPKKTSFKTITREPRNPNSLINDFVYSFYEDKEKNLWIGTDGGGFSIWNRKQNKFTNYRHDERRAQSLSNNSVTGILQDHLNTTWIATFGGGINKFNPATGSFEYYPCINDATGEQHKVVLVLYEDGAKNLWAGTFSNGNLYRFNRSENRFVVFDPQLTNLLAMAEDRNGQLWAGSTGQLVKIDTGKKQHARFGFGKPVRAIHEDRRGNFWVGTEGGGLILFDRQQGKLVRRYSVENGLCNNSILKILEDKKGQLWLSTFNGLSKFNPEDGSFKNYYQSDGLQSNQFLFRSGLRLHSGEFVVGGIRGFNLFYPDSIEPRTFMPPVVLTNLHVNGKPIADAPEYIVQTMGDTIRSLQVPYDDAVLSVNFAALEYSAPNRITYAYYLEGWDNDWNYSPSVRTATYSKLREGTYLLRIKATNAEGIWNKAERIIKITVLPPWYRTLWAYLAYLVLAACLVYLYLQYKTRQTRLEYEVRLAHVQAEKEKELHEKKLSFFTDISHEFRTPLTLIINPLKDYLLHPEKTKDGALQVVYRNARRMLSLVDQLLLFQRADADREELKVSKLNLVLLCRDVFSNFETGARVKQIQFEFRAEQDQITLYADKEKLEIILYNLLSNALKYTPHGGFIRCGVADDEDGATVAIEDSGPGIPEAISQHLFERFYQSQDTKTAAKPGFGIGLYLVKHFVDKHKGNITVSNQPGGGASFQLWFRKGREHLQAYSFVETTVEKTILQELLQDEEAAPERMVPTAAFSDLISNQKSILVVEDDADIRSYVTGIFSTTYRVFEACNGTDGLQLAKEKLPDIIVSDLMMENGNGLELCTAIKTEPATSHIPVILLTAVSSSDKKLQGVEGGADDYITKPFEKDLLLARVKNLLQTRTSLQHYFYNEITLQHNDQKISPEYKAFLDRCISIVEAHLEDDDFTIKKLSQEIGMSHSNLYRKVKEISGQSVSSFIRFLRIRKAAQLLIRGGLNVNEASFQVGISDVKYFRKLFQKQFGMNPSAFSKKYRSSLSDTYAINKEVIGAAGKP